MDSNRFDYSYTYAEGVHTCIVRAYTGGPVVAVGTGASSEAARIAALKAVPK